MYMFEDLRLGMQRKLLAAWVDARATVKAISL